MLIFSINVIKKMYWIGRKYFILSHLILALMSCQENSHENEILISEMISIYRNGNTCVYALIVIISIRITFQTQHCQNIKFRLYIIIF